MMSGTSPGGGNERLTFTLVSDWLCLSLSRTCIVSHLLEKESVSAVPLINLCTVAAGCLAAFNWMHGEISRLYTFISLLSPRSA